MLCIHRLCDLGSIDSHPNNMVNCNINSVDLRVNSEPISVQPMDISIPEGNVFGLYQSMTQGLKNRNAVGLLEYIGGYFFIYWKLPKFSRRQHKEARIDLRLGFKEYITER